MLGSALHCNTGGIARAALTRRLTDGDRAAEGVAFPDWRRPTAIVSRREDERDLVRRRYPEGTIPVWSVDRGGRAKLSRPERRRTETEPLSLLRPDYAPAPHEPEAPRGWLTRLMAFLSRTIRKN